MADVKDNLNRKIARIPLAGIENARNITSTKDQVYQGWVFDKIHNSLTNHDTIYCEKTPIPVLSGLTDMHPSSSYTATSLINIESHSASGRVAGFYNYSTGDSRVVLWDGADNYTVTTSGNPFYLTETKTANYAGTLTTVILVGSDNNTYWFIPMDALTNLTFTGDTHTNTTIDNISSTAGLWVGQEISGTGIQAGTRIAAINSSTSITTSLATTATNSGITITRTIVAKIIDSDFPTDAVGAMVVMNGYTYVITTSGKIHNSDLNSITSWSSIGYISAQAEPDKGISLVKYKNTIIAFGVTSIEFFEDVGNPTGSPLKVIPNATLVAGCLTGTAIRQYDDSIYFIGNTNSTNLNLFELKNYSLQAYKVKRLTTYIQTIRTGLLANLIRLVPILINGKSYLLLTIGTGSSTTTYIFDIQLKEFTSGHHNNSEKNLTSITGSIMYSYSNYKDTNIVTLAGNVGLYTIDTVYGTNNEIRTSPLDFGTNTMKRIHKLRIIGDQDTTTNTLTISYSDDDGQNFSTGRTVTLSDRNPVLMNLGKTRRRIWKIVSSTARAVRLEALEIEYSELDH